MVKMGCHQAGRQNLVGMLQRRSVGIIPEGIAGLFRGANRSFCRMRCFRNCMQLATALEADSKQYPQLITCIARCAQRCVKQPAVPCCAMLTASCAPGRDREQVYWSPRLGVCRIALQTGTPIVPTYDLGQSQVWIC